MNARFLVLIGFAVLFPACSLILDRRADQCSTDGDCAKFAGTRCDPKQRLCVLVSNTLDAGNPASANDAGDGTADVTLEADPCLGPSGCYACAPASDQQFRNACTNAECKPFDNSTRLKNLLPDGGLTPLPPREAGAT
jgi:hypothetical protein